MPILASTPFPMVTNGSVSRYDQMSPGGKIVMAENCTHQALGLLLAVPSLQKRCSFREPSDSHSHPLQICSKVTATQPHLDLPVSIQFLPTSSPDPPVLFPRQQTTRRLPTHCLTFLMVLICCLSSLSECHLQEAGTSAWLVHQ